MICKLCGKEVHLTLPKAYPYRKTLYPCGHTEFQTQEEWEASPGYKEDISWTWRPDAALDGSTYQETDSPV